MLQRAAQWRLLAIAGGLSLLILYLYGLGRMGLYSADEPRYASIGRAMVQTGDYITPRLSGQGWFEKPALLYWMIAAGFRAGLSNDLAPRVPVALFSVAFLFAFFFILRREFGPVAAAYSTMILATSGMWLTYSELAVTDVPMSAFFALALLFTLPWLRTGDRRWLNAAAVALGAAFLSKSTPPLILALPVLWFGRDRWRDLFRPAPVLLFLLVAAPWHIACAMRNGPIFLRTLFIQQQVQRFISPSLQHVQPWWFYFKWLPAALFPWTPAAALLFRRSLYSDKRLQFLLAVAVWGFVFFSKSPNKLPGYVLPLVPPLAILAGVALEKAQVAGRIVIGLCGLACCAFPVLVITLPGLMSRNPYAAAPAIPVLLTVVVVAGFGAASLIRYRPVSLALVAVSAACGYLWIKAETFPYIDAAATARPIARLIQASGEPVCVKPDVPRDWRYGLNYYSDTPWPDCGPDPSPRAFVYYRDHRLFAELP
jgi:4-amino-4-deoxy-L-arabinose transferase-like glycosyltransferase